MYIAQPPLYKIKKGKQEQYLKDDDALTQYLTTAALENTSLHISANAPGITDTALETLVNDYNQVMQLINRMSRLYPQEVLEQLIYQPLLTMEDLKDQTLVSNWVDRIDDLFAEQLKSGQTVFQFSVKEDTERHLFLPVVTRTAHGVAKEFVFTHSFFESSEYSKIADLNSKLDGLLEDGAYVKKGEKVFEVSEFKEALAWLMKEAKRGYYIQRYKGLGEMNPDQLWETTMDPEQRCMLQVTIEDAIAADQIFTTLMGEEVEPRRVFIEDNALNVANLDV